MKITNKFNLPEILLHASRSDRYSRGDSRISVTQLIDSPRIASLRSQHYKDMETDVSERIWALLGTAVHEIIAPHAAENQITEERLFAEVGGWKISGAVDVQHFAENQVVLVDWKVCSVYKVLPGVGDMSSWENQLNCYAELLYLQKGLHVTNLQIGAILRDWSRTKEKTDITYPRSPIMMIDIPLWLPARRTQYLEERVRAHQLAVMEADMGELVHCTDEERWKREEKWAVMKGKNKRATRVFKTQQEATQFIADSDPTAGYFTQHRPGECVRCEGDYCGVARWCEQWQKESQQKVA